MFSLKSHNPNRVFAILGLALFILTMINIGTSHAQTSPLVILTPDVITGQVTAKLNSTTNDARLIEVCVHRIDQNSPDPAAKVACAARDTGSVPLDSSEEAPSGEGLVYYIPFTVTMVPGQDQIFVARNYADVGGGAIIVSADSANSALLPQPIAPPLFIVRAP